MKTQIFTESEIIGKTISYVSSNDGLFIKFDDETFIWLNSDYESGYIHSNETYDQNPTKSNYEELFERGFIDQVKYHELKLEDEEYTRKYDEQKKLKEIAKLRELKAKYPEV